jgi:hypothetical protein
MPPRFPSRTASRVSRTRRHTHDPPPPPRLLLPLRHRPCPVDRHGRTRHRRAGLPRGRGGGAAGGVLLRRAGVEGEASWAYAGNVASCKRQADSQSAQPTTVSAHAVNSSFQRSHQSFAHRRQPQPDHRNVCWWPSHSKWASRIGSGTPIHSCQNQRTIPRASGCLCNEHSRIRSPAQVTWTSGSPSTPHVFQPRRFQQNEHMTAAERSSRVGVEQPQGMG